GDAVSKLVTSLQESFLELTGRRNSWYDRYASLADKAKENNAKVQELQAISQKVMPIIWKNWLGSTMWKMSVYEQAGWLHRIPVNTSVRPHPLYVLDTDLFGPDQFTIEITMAMKKKANIGLRLMWVHEDYSWDNDDILYSAHFRWVYPNRQWGKEKQVVFNTKKDGTWGDSQAVFDQWPDFKIGQKFKMQITTFQRQTVSGEKCFRMRLFMGHERFHLVPSPPPFEYVFCLPVRFRLITGHERFHLIPLTPPFEYVFCLPATDPLFRSNPRHLKLVLNEDIMYDLTDAYDIYEVMYMPAVLHFSN
ncbi:unnamed protein product, partial [Meganyctiphanes norvegica]